MLLYYRNPETPKFFLMKSRKSKRSNNAGRSVPKRNFPDAQGLERDTDVMPFIASCGVELFATKVLKIPHQPFVGA